MRDSDPDGADDNGCLRPAAARPAGCAPHVGLLVETLIAGLVDEFEGQRRYPALVQGGSAHFDRARKDRRRLVSGCREVHRSVNWKTVLTWVWSRGCCSRPWTASESSSTQAQQQAACAEPHRQ